MTVGQLKLDNVKKSYGDVEVIQGVSLDVKHGEFIVFVGPSGCGKSTLLRMIAGLEEITAGDVVIDDKVVNTLPPVKRGIAMVFQSYALYPHMSVYENIAFPLRVEKKSNDEVDEKVRKAAEILHLTPRLNHRPGELSGGQRQRVAIGRAIVREPSVFLFDEPLSNLDAALRATMRVELTKLHHDLDATMIYVTHDQVEAMTMADRIVVLDAGEIAQVGTPLELYHKPDNLFVAGFIGNPKMNFIEVTGKGSDKDGVRVEVPNAGEFVLPVTPHDEDKINGQTLTLGIRPEHTHLEKGDIALNLTANVVERLGIHTVGYANRDGIDEVFCTVQTGSAPIKAGEQFKLRFDAKDCHLFDDAGRVYERKIQFKDLSLPDLK